MADYPGGVPASGGGSSSTPVTSHYANLVLEGWAATATLAGEVLTGSTPDSFDGVAKATAVTYLMPPNNDSIRLIAIGDGDKSKWGVYEVTSVDLTTLELTRTVDLSDADAVVFPDKGDLGSGGGSLHYNADLSYTSKVPGSNDKLSGADANVPKRIAASMIYLDDQPGTLSADGKTFTLDSPLPARDGFAPANNYYVILAGQNGNYEDKENGHWVQVSSTELQRLSWLDDFREIKHNQEYIIVAGKKYLNSVWRLISGGSFNVNPASVPVRFECIQKGLYTDDSILTYLFDESSGDVLNRSIHADNVGMDGTLNNSAARTTGGGSPRTPHRLHLPATGYVEIADPEKVLLDTQSNWEVTARGASTDNVQFLRRDNAGTWETGGKIVYIDGSGNLVYESFGSGSVTFAHGSLNDGTEHHIKVTMINGEISGYADGVFLGKSSTSAPNSNTGHNLRIGNHGTSTESWVADLVVRQL